MCSKFLPPKKKALGAVVVEKKEEQLLCTARAFYRLRNMFPPSSDSSRTQKKRGQKHEQILFAPCWAISVQTQTETSDGRNCAE
jgi:hypothetical protein